MIVFKKCWALKLYFEVLLIFIILIEIEIEVYSGVITYRVYNINI